MNEKRIESVNEREIKCKYTRFGDKNKIHNFKRIANNMIHKNILTDSKRTHTHTPIFSEHFTILSNNPAYTIRGLQMRIFWHFVA